MSKEYDIQCRLDWFKSQFLELEQIAAEIRALDGNVLQLAMDPRVKQGPGGIARFAAKYTALHATITTDLYPAGAVAEGITGRLLHQAGRQYAEKEAIDHGLTAQVADMLKNYCQDPRCPRCRIPRETSPRRWSPRPSWAATRPCGRAAPRRCTARSSAPRTTTRTASTTSS